MPQQFRRVLEDPEYWEGRAEELMTQASMAMANGQFIFAKTLENHSRDCQNLAKMAFNIRLSKARSSKILPKHRLELVSSQTLKQATNPTNPTLNNISHARRDQDRKQG